MLRNVFAKSLWDQRRGIIAWCLGIAVIGTTYSAFYPSVNTPEMAAALRAYPTEILEALGMADITSAIGYIGSTTYGLLGPLLMIVFAALLGTRAVAGDEESGRLDVLLAHPIERWQFVLQRAAAMIVALTLAGLALFVAMAAAAGPFQFATQIAVANLAASSFQLALLAMLFGALALAVGAATGRRSLAAAAVAVVGVIGYFANTLGPSIEALAWTRDISPFHYYSGGMPLRNGLQIGDSLVLISVIVVLVGLAIVGFRRRDIAV